MKVAVSASGREYENGNHERVDGFSFRVCYRFGKFNFVRSSLALETVQETSDQIGE